jgi:hypothetical protein
VLGSKEVLSAMSRLFSPFLPMADILNSRLFPRIEVPYSDLVWNHTLAGQSLLQVGLCAHRQNFFVSLPDGRYWYHNFNPHQTCLLHWQAELGAT